MRRSPKKGHYDRTRIEKVLDRALVAHVAFLDNGEPVCIPMLHARGVGAQVPLAASSTAAGRYRNERVEIWML